MQPHLSPLVGSERPWLEQDRVPNADLSDVVKQCALLNDVQVVSCQSNLLGNPARVEGDPPGVPLRFGISVVECGDHSFDQTVGSFHHDALQVSLASSQL